MENSPDGLKKVNIFLQNVDVQKLFFYIVHNCNVVLRWFYHVLKNGAGFFARERMRARKPQGLLRTAGFFARNNGLVLIHHEL